MLARPALLCRLTRNNWRLWIRSLRTYPNTAHGWPRQNTSRGFGEIQHVTPKAERVFILGEICCLCHRTPNSLHNMQMSFCNRFISGVSFIAQYLMRSIWSPYFLWSFVLHICVRNFLLSIGLIDPTSHSPSASCYKAHEVWYWDDSPVTDTGISQGQHA